jgi:hypothetical protein
VITVMRQRLAAGEQVARIYQEPGLAWLERQAEATEELVVERQAAEGCREAERCCGRTSGAHNHDQR